MSTSVCVKNFIKIGRKWLRYSLQGVFNMAAAAILENGVGPSWLSFFDSACKNQSAYKISSKSVDKWPIYSVGMVLAASAC
jgi:hypothetical protein